MNQETLLAKAKEQYPTVEQFRINGNEVEGYFDNSCGEFISSVHDDEMIPTGIWMPLNIDWGNEMKWFLTVTSYHKDDVVETEEFDSYESAKEYMLSMKENADKFVIHNHFDDQEITLNLSGIREILVPLNIN